MNRRKKINLQACMGKIASAIRKVPPKHKRILLFIFIAFFTLMFLDFPQKADAIVINDIAAWGRQAAEKIAQNQQKVVERYFGSYNPAFAYLCYCAQGFAVFPAAIGFMRWLNDEDDLKIWIELVAPIIVLIGLANGGYILGQIILFLYKAFDGIINTFDGYTGYYEMIKEGKARALIGPSISPLFKQCEALVGAEQSACFGQVSQQALKMAQEYKQDFGNAEWLQDWVTRLGDLAGKWLDPKTNVLDKLRTTFWTITSPAWEGILTLLLLKVMEVWQSLYGIAFIFAGIAAPMAATASLFTGSKFLSSAYALWLTGMFVIFLARLLLYVGYGLASDLVVAADASTDTIWFGVVMGLALPFCVFSIAKGSAAGVWASLVGTGAAALTFTTLNQRSNHSNAGGGSSPAQSSPSSLRVETRY